jgi:hypothetical protein
MFLNFIVGSNTYFIRKDHIYVLIFLGAHLLNHILKTLLILILNVFNDYNNLKLVIMVKNKFVHLIIM